MNYRIAIALATFGTAVQANPAAIHSSDAITLFERVCLGDQVSLPKSKYGETPYKLLPSTSRAALAYTIPKNADFPANPAQPKLAEVGNKFIRALPTKNLFLMLPVSEPNARYSDTCAIVWQGKHYDDAVQAIKQQLPVGTPFPPPPPKKPAWSVNYIRYGGSGVIFGAAEYENWTVLYVAPELLPIKD